MGITKIINKVRLKKWIKEGLVVGKNLQLERGARIDSSFPWLITIGDNVTLAPDSFILSHDGSTKKCIGYSKVGKVNIGNNVFIGAKSIILPGVNIGDNSVIGAGSIVTTNVESGTVVSGIPAKVVMGIDSFTERHRNKMEKSFVFGSEFTRGGGITIPQKEEMIKKLEDGGAYIP